MKNVKKIIFIFAIIVVSVLAGWFYRGCEVSDLSRELRQVINDNKRTEKHLSNALTELRGTTTALESERERNIRAEERIRREEERVREAERLYNLFRESVTISQEGVRRLFELSEESEKILRGNVKEVKK